MNKEQLDNLVWNEVIKQREAKIIQNDDGSYIMNQMPFHVEMKNFANVKEFLTYRFVDKYISYDLVSVGFDNGDIIGTPQESSGFIESDSKLKYWDCFGKGIDIEVNVSKEGVGKNIVINSLSDLGDIPENVEYVEVIFKINTNFDFFNNINELTIDDNIKLTNNTYIGCVKSWDSENNNDEYTNGLFYKEGDTIYLKKKISLGFLKSAIFPIYSDLFIGFNTKSNINNFTSAFSGFISISCLDNTNIVVVYSDNENSGFGTAIIGTVMGDKIVYGTKYVFQASGFISYITTLSLDSTHFVVTYQSSTSNSGKSVIGTVSGTVISYGSTYEFIGGSTNNICSAKIDSTHFVVAYSDNSINYNSLARIGTVSGSVISYGDEYEFNATSTTNTYVAVLDNTHFVVVYGDNGNSSYGTAIIGTVSGGVISYGSEYVFNVATTYNTSVAALDSTHFVVVYRDDGNSSYGTTIVGTVSGSVISYGSEYIFNVAYTSNISVVKLDSTHFVVAYRDDGNSNYGTAILGTVSGSTISYGSEYIFNAVTTSISSNSISLLDSSRFVIVYAYDIYAGVTIGTISEIGISYSSEYVFISVNSDLTAVATLDNSHFVIAYQYNGGYAIIGTITNNIISYGSAYAFNSNLSVGYTTIDALDSTHFVITYQDINNGYYGTAIIGTVNGGVISFGSKYVFNSAITYYISVAKINSTQFVVAYQDRGNSYYGTSKIGTVSGSVISFGSTYIFNSATSVYIWASLLDSTHFVIVYRDDGNSQYGTAIIGTISGTAISYGSEYVFASQLLYWARVSALDSTHFVVCYVVSGYYAIVKVGTVSGTAISYGTGYIFNSNGLTTNASIISLDSTHFVVAYRDDGNSNYGTAIVGTVSGSTISCSSKYMFNVATSNFTSVAKLNNTHFVVTYSDAGNNNYGTSIIGKVQNDNLVFSYTIYSLSSTYTSVAKLDSTHFVVSYRNASSYGAAKIGTISGNVITYGSEYVFNAATTDFISVSALDTTHFVVAYRDSGNSDYGTAIIGTVSGTAISYGSEYVFNTASTSYKSVLTIDSTHFILIYSNVGGSNGNAVIGTVSGTAISYGTVYAFNTATNYISASLLDSTHFVISYSDGSNSSYGTAIIGTVSGTAISYGSEYVFNAATTTYISVAKLDSTHFVVTYTDNGNGSYGTSIIGTVSGGVISYGNEYIFNVAATTYTSVAALDSTHFIVTYTDGGNSSYGTTIVGTVSSNVISYGSEYVTKDSATTDSSVAAVDNTHAFLVNNNKGVFITYTPTILGKIINAVMNIFWNAVSLIKWNNI